MNASKLADFVAMLSLEKKAENIKIFDLRKLASFTDYFVICTGTSNVQVKAIHDYLNDKLREKKINICHTEGRKTYNWVLLDLFDVVVHIFSPELREFYSLEKLWGDAKIIEVNDES